MNLKEATIKALATGGYMYREEDSTGRPEVFVKPSSDVRGLFTMYSTFKESVIGWQPSVSDVLADDWSIMPASLIKIRGESEE